MRCRILGIVLLRWAISWQFCYRDDTDACRGWHVEAFFDRIGIVPLRLWEVEEFVWETAEISRVERLQKFRFSLSLLREGFASLL